MIAKGTTHNAGGRLAHYLVTGKGNERAELFDLRGFASDDIVEAFRSVHVIAAGTRCEQPFFHVQVRNPEGETLTRDQWRTVADRYERMLGLSGQPRAIAFHIDETTGHEHMHLAWSRIDDETMTAKPLPFFKERLIKTSRELEVLFDLTRVKSERDGPIKYAPTRGQEEQARRLGVDIHDARDTIRHCWEHSDNGRSFQTALADQGLILAQGDRGKEFVVIDQAGAVYALGKRILDMTAAKIRDRVADLPRHELPTVEQAREMVQAPALNRQQEKEKPAPEPVADRDDKPEPEGPKFKGIAARILADWAYSEERDFAAVLKNIGVGFAIVTKDEAERSRMDAATAEQAGKYAPRFGAGELVAVTRAGLVYWSPEGEIVELNGVHKFQPEAEKFLPQQLDRSALQGIDATKAALEDRQPQRGNDNAAAAGMERVTDSGDSRSFRPLQATRRWILAVNDKAVDFATVATRPMKIISSVLNTAGKLFDGLFQLFDPGPRKTRAQPETALELNPSADTERTPEQVQRPETQPTDHGRVTDAIRDIQQRADKTEKDLKRHRGDRDR